MCNYPIYGHSFALKTWDDLFRLVRSCFNTMLVFYFHFPSVSALYRSLMLCLELCYPLSVLSTHLVVSGDVS